MGTYHFDDVKEDIVMLVICSYPSARPVVMQVHQGSPIPLLSLLGVNEHSRERATVTNVIRTTSPVKGAPLVPAGASFGGVTRTVHQLTSAARSRDGVHNPG